MFIWLIALIVVASVATVGYYQGGLRAAFSFVGLLAAAMLGSPLGSLLKSIVPIFGVKNPVMIAFVAPVIAFVLVLVIFKVAAFGVHKKVEAWYKYKGSDTQRMLWERMNNRGSTREVLFITSMYGKVLALQSAPMSIESHCV